MKILHLTISGDLIGGGDTIISNILMEKNIEVVEYLATFFKSTFMTDLSLKSGTKYYYPKNNIKLFTHGRLWSVEIIFRNIKFILKLKKTIQEEKIDIIHAHGFPSAIASLILKILCGVKIVYTHHFFRNKASNFEKFFLSIIYNNFDANTGVSRTVCDSMNLSFPKVKNKFEVVYNCVSKDFLNLKTNSKDLFIDQKRLGRKIFVQAARFNKIKNHIYVTKAIANLEKCYQDKIFIVFLGDGEERLVVENFVKTNNLEKCFLFKGAVNPNDVPVIMSSCDYGLFPSELEGFGLGAVECMSLGLPVIALNNELMIEIVGDSGILDSKDNLDKSFIKMLSIGESLRQKAKNRSKLFSSSDMKLNYIKFYKKALSK
jgi:glycosyltransferase involved in cell wall biosynthesis